MSQPQPAPTYEGVLKLFRKTAKQIRKTNKTVEALGTRVDKTSETVEALGTRVDKTSETVEALGTRVDKTSETVGALGNRVGDMIEKLLGEGNLVAQFKELGHRVKTHSRNKVFGEKGTPDSGEIDLFLEDGDVAILVEAKTTLKMDDVREHIKRMEKYRRFVDADGNSGKRFIGAVAGTVIAENVLNFAHESGLYVIVQSARAVEIVPSPANFVAKKW